MTIEIHFECGDKEWLRLYESTKNDVGSKHKILAYFLQQQRDSFPLYRSPGGSSMKIASECLANKRVDRRHV